METNKENQVPETSPAPEAAKPQASAEAQAAKTEETPLVIVSELEKQAKESFDHDLSRAEGWVLRQEDPKEIHIEAKTAEKDFAKWAQDVSSDWKNFTQSETFEQTKQAGIEFATGLGSMIAEGWGYGFEKLMEVPVFKEVAEQVDREINSLRHNELLKEGVIKTEKVIEEANQSLFRAIRSFFSVQDQLPAKIYTFDEDPKQES